jgi:hypothetical protein
MLLAAEEDLHIQQVLLLVVLAVMVEVVLVRLEVRIHRQQILNLEYKILDLEVAVLVIVPRLRQHQATVVPE